MSRSSVRTYLVQAKKLLQSPQEGSKASFVVGNESADLDSIVSAVVYGYIQSTLPQERRTRHTTISVTNIPAADLTLRPELTALLKHADVKPSDLITLDDVSNLNPAWKDSTWTLVDHNALTGPLASQVSATSIMGVIDHHDDENVVSSTASPRIIEKSGSCTSLVTNHIRSSWDLIATGSSSLGAAIAQDCGRLLDDTAYTSTWDAQVAKLALGAILIDTTNLKSEDKVTEHDRKAIRYLEARVNASMKLGKGYDRDRFFMEISEAKADLDSLSLNDVLRKDYKQWSEGDLTLGIASVVKPVEWLVEKEELVPTLVSFARERSLQLMAVMTAYTDDGGQFARQLLLLALEDGKPKEVAESFAKSCAQDLQLKQSNLELKSASQAAWLQLWNQGNVSASRKQVAPLLRKAATS